VSFDELRLIVLGVICASGLVVSVLRVRDPQFLRPKRFRNLSTAGVVKWSAFEALGWGVFLAGAVYALIVP
jgi:hypothetical protein